MERIVTMRPGEGATAWLMFTYSFLAMTCHNIIKPITRSKFITDLGADNLPYALLAAGFLIGILMELHSRATRRLPREAIIPATQAGLLVILLLFWVLFRQGVAWASAGFYLFGLIFGILLISQFWTLANAIYESRQARRLFGFIGGGASLGGMMGSSLTVLVVSRVGTTNLLLVSAAVLAACAAITIVTIRRQRVSDTFSLSSAEEGVSGQEALNLLRRSRHLRVIAAVIASAAIAGTLIEQQLNMAAEALGGEDRITEFLAAITFYVSLFGFVMQVAFTSRIHRSLGLVFALTILPIGLGTTAIIILATGAIWAVAAARIFDTALRYSLDKTTREVLFLPLPGDVRDRAKPFVDVTVDRFGKAIAAVLMLILIKPWGLGLDWRGLSFASLLLMGVWIAVALAARKEYVRSFRRSLDARTIEPATVRVDVADARTIETLVEELASPDDASVLYAIDMLETLDKRHLITPLLLHHESAPVRARALAALQGAPVRRPQRWIPAVHRMLKDADADVRAAAVRALGVLQQADVADLMSGYLQDPDPRLVVTAAASLADSGRPDAVRAAEAAFGRLIADTRQISRDARREAAVALSRVRNPEFRSLLVPLIHDPDVEVARQAIASARVMGAGHTLFVPALVGLLGHRVLKREARDALLAYDDIVGILAYVLQDRDEHPWVRRHIPATLASIPGPPSVDVLFAALGDSDGFLRYKIIEALETLRCGHDELVFNADAVEAQVVKESNRYFMYLSLRYNIAQHDASAEGTLLLRALDDKLARTIDRLYRLLGLRYPWRDIAAARTAISSADLRRRAGAVEYLDQVLTGVVRKRVMPIVDVEPLAEKVRYANNMIKSRPRDLDDTLAQLVHDDDPVVAAAAIGDVSRRQLRALEPDLEHIVERRTADQVVVEAAGWALAGRGGTGDRALTALPVVEVADRLRALPLFSVVSVDELFRIAASARQVAHERGRVLGEEGQPAAEVQCLIEGSVRLTGTGAPESTVSAPAALGFEEVLEGRPLTSTASAVTSVVCLALPADTFLTMLSDNRELAQGVFRLVLASRSSGVWVSTAGEPAGARPPRVPEDAAAVRAAAGASGPPAASGLSVLDKALLLRRTPLLGRASVDQLMALAAVAREAPIAGNRVLATEDDSPAIYHVLAGSLRIESADAAPGVIGPGATVGAAETLAGAATRWRVTGEREGIVLTLGRDELFDVLSGHVDLLQGLFSGALRSQRADAPSAPVAAVAGDVRRAHL